MKNIFSNRLIKPYLYCCDNIITGANKQFIDFAGFELDELLGKSLIEIGEMLKINSQIYLDSINNKYSGYIFTKLLHPREVTITLFKDIITDGKSYSFCEKPNSRLDKKLLFEQGTFIDDISGVAVYSANGLILLKANPKYIKLMNSTFNKESDIIGRPIKDIIKEYVNSQAEVSWSSIFEKHKSSYIKEFKDDKLVQNTTYWVFAQNCIFEKGKIKYIFETASKVTKRVFKNQCLEWQNKIIKKELKSQGEFLVNISHELKTPLNVIFATAQLFSMYCNSGSLDDNKNSIIKYIDSIKQNSYKLTKLINNIVDVSKIQAGFFKLNLSNNNIVQVVEEIVVSITNFTDSKGIHITFDTDTEEKIIACDPEKIERIVLNLISNAIKFSDEGDEIFVDIKDKIEFVEISVKDNGIGIESKHLNMIFDRFKQVEKSLDRNAEGTGIGLNLVKSIVELHGGSICVESEVGKGSKFTVKLPSTLVAHQNMIYNSKVKNDDETIRVELSGLCS